jgi:hypothetical protein
VCMDYYQVACHDGIGTNPFGAVYELMKLSSVQKNDGLDSGKYSFIDPDVAERNTLGDDFQVDEYNNNRLASSQNSLGSFHQSPKSQKKSSQDIFYKSFQSSTKYAAPSTTPRPRTTSTSTTTTTTTTTTAAPLIFRSPISTRGPSTSSATPRRPNLETFESYEVESVNGFGGSRQNSFDQNSYKNYDDSFEVRDPQPSPTTSTTTTTTTTTRRPPVFQNTFRTSFPSPSSTLSPQSPQTYQQQATRFHDDFFRKVPDSTDSSVPKTSKFAQFYVNSNSNNNFYSTQDFYDQPSTKSVYRTTTEVPSTTTQRYTYEDESSSSQYDIIRTTDAPSRQLFSAKTSDRGLSNRGQSAFTSSPGSSPSRTTTTDSIKQSKFFNPPQSTSSSDNDAPQPFRATIITHSQPKEESIRPRSFSGTSNNANQVGNVRQSNRDNFGFSTIPPPTTAEPPVTTTYATSSATNARSNTYFQRLTTLKPEKFSIFFSKATTYANKEYNEDRQRYSSTPAVYYDDETTTTTYRPPTTTRYPEEYERQKTSAASSFDSTRVRDYTQGNRKNQFVSSTEYFAPESTTTSAPLTTERALRRGARRRINRPRQEVPKDFDTEFKYSRRTEAPISTKDNNPDEIFNAEASVFPGRPKSNLFHDEVY